MPSPARSPSRPKRTRTTPPAGISFGSRQPNHAACADCDSRVAGSSPPPARRREPACRVSLGCARPSAEPRPAQAVQRRCRWGDQVDCDRGAIPLLSRCSHRSQETPMNRGVPRKHWSLTSDLSRSSSPAQAAQRAHARRRSVPRSGYSCALIFSSAALASPATVGLGSGHQLLGAGRLDRHEHRPDDDVRRSGAQPRLVGDRRAARPRARRTSTTPSRSKRRTPSRPPTTTPPSRPTNGSAGTDLAGQTFTAGVRTASSSLLLSSGSVTLDAQGDPNAVFIFQVGSTLTTGSNTSVSLVNGAQACNVFWQIGSSATLGTGTALRRHRHGRRHDHRRHRRHDPRQAAGADGRGQPGHEHDHQLHVCGWRRRNHDLNRNARTLGSGETGGNDRCELQNRSAGNDAQRRGSTRG